MLMVEARRLMCWQGCATAIRKAMVSSQQDVYVVWLRCHPEPLILVATEHISRRVIPHRCQISAHKCSFWFRYMGVPNL